MNYITDTISYPHYTSKAFQLYFGDMKLAVLDIETTGLNPGRSRFVLGGLLTEEEQGLRVHQFFAENTAQEQETLEAFLAAVYRADIILTYNGKHFDIPFICRRAQLDSSRLPYNLDLYLLVKNYCPLRSFLPNLKQKTLENFMGLWEYRKDEISGKESIELYYRYLSERDPAVRQTILLHNHDDIIQLYRLLRVLDKADLHRAMYHMGFPVASGTPRISGLIVEKISLSESSLTISGRQGPEAVSYCCFEWEGIPCSAQFTDHDRTFCISVPVICHSSLLLVDLKALRMDISAFEKYPGCQEGFLVLQERGKPHYLEINHFVKACLERILNQWITKKPQQR